MSESVRMGDIIRFGITTRHPTSGDIRDTDETPRWYVYEEASDTAVYTGEFTKRTGTTGIYRGTITASGGWVFDPLSYYEILASGKVGGVTDFAIIKTFVLDDVFNANIIHYQSGSPNNLINLVVSGVLEDIATIDEMASGVWTQDPSIFNTGFGAQLQPIYFADIKQYFDTANNRDEYGVQWFNGPTAVTSGQLTNPAISVYRTDTGASIFQNQKMDYTSPVLGSVRYQTTTLLASGEPYLAIVSGTISSSTRVFPKIIGRHSL